MIKKSKLNSAYLIVIAILFIFYLRENLITDAIRDLGIYRSNIIFIILAGILGLGLLYISSNKHLFYLKIDNFLQCYKRLILAISMLSIFWALFYPDISMLVPLFLLFPILIIYLVYYATFQYDDIKYFNYIIFLGFIVLCITYYQYTQIRIQAAVLGSEHLASSYYIIYLLPVILSSKKPIVSISSIVLSFIIVVTSSKRAGTIALLLAFLTYLVVEYILVNKHKRSRIKYIVLISLGLYCAFIYFVDYISSNDLLIVERFLRLSEGTQDESRFQIWMITWDLIQSSNVFQFFFGHGFNAVMRDNPMGFSAHNDFLEIMYDFGLFVFLAYIIFHIKLIKKCMVLIRNKSSYAAPFAFSVVLFIINSSVSHIIIYLHYSMLFAFVWSLLIGLDIRERIYKK